VRKRQADEAPLGGGLTDARRFDRPSARKVFGIMRAELRLSSALITAVGRADCSGWRVCGLILVAELAANEPSQRKVPKIDTFLGR
jgi:hypothetical protein